MADDSAPAALDHPMMEDGTSAPPIDNIHNVSSESPAPPASFTSFAEPPPLPQTLVAPETISDQTNPQQNNTIPPIAAAAAAAAAATSTTTDSQLQNTNAMPASTRSTNRAVNGTPEAQAPAPTPTPLPARAASHGAPVRRYLNEKVTGVLLQGMRKLALEQPENPLEVLGEFLLQKSKELENTGAAAAAVMGGGAPAA